MSAQQPPEAGRDQARPMHQDELAAFLAQGIVCRLGCLDGDGHPYVVPVWFHYADGGFYIIPRERSLWARYLQRDGRVSLCINSAESPYRRVLAQGQATLVEEPNVGGRWVEIGKQMAVRYQGSAGLDYLTRTLNEPRWLFFVRPARLTTWQGGWAERYKHYQW